MKKKKVKNQRAEIKSEKCPSCIEYTFVKDANGYYCFKCRYRKNVYILGDQYKEVFNKILEGLNKT